MRRISKRSRWPARRRNLLLGLLLALLQLLVLGGVVIWPFPLPWWLYVGAGAVIYLLIPGLAGFLAAQKTGDDNVGVGAGCLVGAVGIVVAVIAILILPSLARSALSSPSFQSHFFSGDFFLPIFLVIEGLVLNHIG